MKIKILMLSLLFPLIVLGQEIDSTGNWIEFEDSSKVCLVPKWIYNSSDTGYVSTMMNNIFEFESDLIKSYSQYEADCYNDSIYKAVPSTPIPNDEGFIDAAFDPLIWRWVHTTPTFEGYIEWLRRKYR